MVGYVASAGPTHEISSGLTNMVYPTLTPTGMSGPIPEYGSLLTWRSSIYMWPGPSEQVHWARTQMAILMEIIITMGSRSKSKRPGAMVAVEGLIPGPEY